MVSQCQKAYAVFFILLFSYLSGQPLQVDLTSESFILINGDSGKILAEKNSHLQRCPASITKIATALFVLKQASLDQRVTIQEEALQSLSEAEKKKRKYQFSSYWLEPDGTMAGIKAGEQMTVRDLLYGTLLVSGNDAANALALHVGGTILRFVEQLNLYVQSLGCQKTMFYNPHGLYFPGHQTTAHDMALIAREAMKNPQFCEIVSSTRYSRPPTNLQPEVTWKQTNKLLLKGDFYYSKAMGVKTGYHSKAKNTLVAAAKEGNRKLIAVLMGCEERKDIFVDAKKIFETAFNQKKVRKTFFNRGAQNFSLSLSGAASSLSTYIKEEVAFEYYPAEEEPLKCFLYWDKFQAPIEKDQKVGDIALVKDDGSEIARIPLFAKEGVELLWWAKMGRLLISWEGLIGVVASIGALLFIWRRFQSKSTILQRF